MAENSFQDWWSDLQANKRSRIAIEKIKLKKSLQSLKTNSKKILILSDVNGLGDAIMLRGVIKPFVDDGYTITLITKEYHKDAYSYLDIKIVLWENIDKLLDEEFRIVIAHHFNARSYDALLSIRAYEKYIINCRESLKDIITVNAVLKPKNIWQVYDNFLHYFGYKYNLVDFQEEKRLLDRFNLQKESYLAIHIGSGSLCKNWGVENFKNLAKELDRSDIKYYFIAGPFEKNILQRHKVENIVSDLSFFELVEFLRNAQCIVCHGTSILHLGVTVNTPTISINSTYDYNFWHPYKDLTQYKEQHIALTSKSSTNCSKYRRFIDFALGINKNGCPILKKEIKVEMILDKIKGN